MCILGAGAGTGDSMEHPVFLQKRTPILNISLAVLVFGGYLYISLKFIDLKSKAKQSQSNCKIWRGDCLPKKADVEQWKCSVAVGAK